jgi:hypothetical protein
MRLFRRRRFIVDGHLQLRLIAASLGYVAFYIIMMAVSTFIPLVIEMRSANPNSHRAYLLANSFIYLHRHIWPVALIVLGAVSAHSLLFSHKVAGPLYRFRQIFRALGAGKVPGQQRLRKGDYLKPEMKLINEMLYTLQIKTTELQEAQTAIAKSIACVVQKSKALSDKELILLVEDLDAQGKRLAEHVLRIDGER